MKKFLVLAAAASLSASSALAGAGDFYAKGTVGYAKFNNEKLAIKKGSVDRSYKFKAKNGSATFGVGAGYYITDIIRADLMIEHFSNMQHKYSTTEQGTKVDVKIKARSTAAMINGYVDFFDVSDVKFFAGAGLGMVRTAGKVSISALEEDSYKLKTKNAMAYAVHLGATTQVVDDVNVDLTYSWRDLGSVTAKNEDDVTYNFPYRGHQVALGIRYDI